MLVAAAVRRRLPPLVAPLGRARRCVAMHERSVARAAALIALGGFGHARTQPAAAAQPPSMRLLPRAFQEDLTPRTRLGFLAVLRRLARWAAALGPVVLWGPLAYLCGGAVAEAWWKHALWGIEASGPTLTKLAQWAATRRDLFPRTACVRLSRLQVRAHRHSMRESRFALDAALGESWPQWLKLGKAVGSGVIAQVHRGTLVDSGRPVAVKIVHPALRDALERDVHLLRTAARFVEGCAPWVFEWFDPQGAVEEFSSALLASVSMEREAASLARLHANFEGRKNVRVPRPIVARDARDAGALVETFEAGLPLDEAIDILTKVNADEAVQGRMMLARRQLAQRGLGALLQMLFVDNFVHADMHAGNLLVYIPSLGAEADDAATVEAIANDDFELVLLDAGLVVELEPRYRRNFVELFSAIVVGDGKHAGELLLDRARHEKCTDRAAFVAAVAGIVTKFTTPRGGDARRGLTLANVQVAELLAEVLALCYSHKVRLETRFTTTICAIAIVEGIGSTLDPDLDLLQAAWPMLAPWRVKMERGVGIVRAK
ncbi:ABC1 family-domain-containing protein [Pelagophyceae sp. CCMP2097]|nr:ABC1 family-domain-containing protein [Pelagophyceae sp. CCMP2097]